MSVVPPDSSTTLSHEATIHPTATIQDTALGPWTEIGARTILRESTVGAYSYIADSDTDVWCADIGPFVSIASHARINPVQHPMDRPTQHHFTYRRKQYGFDKVDDEGLFSWRRAQRVIIEPDVWIGHGAIIMPGVKIGLGAVIGSGAIVTKDVEPFAIVVGSPGRTIRHRFDTRTQEAITASRWWEWDHETIKERFSDFIDMEKFLLHCAQKEMHHG